MSQSEKKVILINAATVKLAGGLVVSLDITQLLAESEAYKIILVCPNIKSYSFLPKTIQRIYSPSILLRFFFRWILDFFWLPLKIKKSAPDIVLTLGNLPARTKLNQLMLNDNAFVSQKQLSDIPLQFGNKLKHSLRKWLFWKRLSYVKCLLVQTQTEVNRLRAFNRKLPEMRVLAPLLPRHLNEEVSAKDVLPSKDSGLIRLLCLSYYWDHKNIGVLKEVLVLAKKRKLKLQIVFTLNEKKVKGGKRLVQALQPYISEGYAINVGNIKANAIRSYISRCDGLILPSFIETYGLNSLEAWYCQKVFFVADRAYSREVCDGAAVYFNLTQPSDILNKIIQTFDNDKRVSDLIKKGNEQLTKLPDRKSYVSIIEEVLQ